MAASDPLFARQAAILLSNTEALADARRLSAQLIEVLNNRDIIGQAKGVLIARGAVDDQAALRCWPRPPNAPTPN